MGQRDANELERQLEAAFDYRGDVTLTLKSGEQVEGYLFNRDFAPHPKAGEAPFVDVFLRAGGQARYRISEIEAVELSGEDPARAG